MPLKYFWVLISVPHEFGEEDEYYKVKELNEEGDNQIC